MTEVNSNILERVRALPAAQQKYFHQLPEDGEDNPREAASSLRQALSDGEVDQDYLLASTLAAAALNDPHSPDKFPTETQARQGYRDEINRLRETDEDCPVAAHLEGMLDRLSEREEAAQTKVDEVAQKQEQHQLQQQEAARAAYESSYDARKQERIAELTRWGAMDVQEAEAQFMEIEHPKLSASLMRLHGISA